MGMLWSGWSKDTHFFCKKCILNCPLIYSVDFTFKTFIMPSIFVPVTKSNFNFLKVHHPKPIKFINRDRLGLAFGSIIKHNYKSYKKIDEAILRTDYPEEIEIIYERFHYPRNSKICSRGVRAINNQIARLIQFELNAYIRIEMRVDPDVEIRTKIYEFLQKYGLSDHAKYVATLERQNRRYRTLIGDLKK